MTTVRVLAVAPPQLGDWPAVLRGLVERHKPNVVCLLGASGGEIEAARSVRLRDGAVLVDAGTRGWHQVGSLLLVTGEGEVLVVGVVGFASASVLASFGRVERTEASPEMNYTVVLFHCLAGHVLGVKLEVAP